MSSRRRKYNLSRIRVNYTYSVEEIAELLGVATMTVFRWIANEGLNRLPNSKKYFVHGSVVKDFLDRKNGKNKKPCAEHEIYCCKCRKPQFPNLQSLKTKSIPNGTIRLLGKCSLCSTAVNKVISGKKWDQNHPFYPNINAGQKQHKGESESQHKCKNRKDSQLCLNLTLLTS
jgi:excisionase family DNA binding protein